MFKFDIKKFGNIIARLYRLAIQCADDIVSVF